MTISLKIKAFIKDERVRNKAFKLCLFSLLSGATYLALNFGKPHGTFGKKNYLEG